jgi:hypothetical protein
VSLLVPVGDKLTTASGEDSQKDFEVVYWKQQRIYTVWCVRRGFFCPADMPKGNDSIYLWFI